MKTLIPGKFYQYLNPAREGCGDIKLYTTLEMEDETKNGNLKFPNGELDKSDMFLLLELFEDNVRSYARILNKDGEVGWIWNCKLKDFHLVTEAS